MAITNKLDLKKTLPYRAGATPSWVTLPAKPYLQVEGHGDPNTSPAYTQAIEALYTTAYTLKFMLKKGGKTLDFAVMPLEALWWADNMSAFTQGKKNDWNWRALILMPDFVTEEAVQAAITAAAQKKDLPALPKLRLIHWEEGRAAQVMHTGPYATEGPTIERLHAFIQQEGYKLSGLHHEIYLSDPRRTVPEKMKTIIRQPALPA